MHGQIFYHKALKLSILQDFLPHLAFLAPERNQPLANFSGKSALKK
jgi:hypothetical protein